MSVADMRCETCRAEVDVIVTCPECRATACLDCYHQHILNVAALFRDVYGPDFAELATYQAEGR